MSAGKKITQEEAEKRFLSLGFELRSFYVNNRTKVTLFCKEHRELHEAAPSNVFKGQGLKCCHRDKAAKNRRGARASDETRLKLSAYRGEAASGYGRTPSLETRERISASVKSLHRSSIEYEILRAKKGKTAEQKGFFYIAKLPGGILKFGSVVRLSIQERLRLLKKQYGAASIALVAQVSDAGGYEAAMMKKHGGHWIRGELFRDFLGAA